MGSTRDKRQTTAYEDLTGALGRGMFFRPERRRIKDLVSAATNARLLVDGTEYPLFDVSIGGLSFIGRGNKEPWTVGSRRDITLQLQDRELHVGPGRIARVERTERGCRVGIELVCGVIDLPEISNHDEAARFEAALKGGAQRTDDLIPPCYRNQVGRAAFFLQYYRQILDRREATLRRRGASEANIERCAHDVCDALRGMWRAVCRDASRAAKSCLEDPQVKQAAKDYTEAMITPLLLEVPMCNRAYTKPLGYAGDYQVMLYYYANRLEGASIFAKVFHKYFVEHPLSNGVRTRSGYVVDLLADELDRTRRGASQPFRVTSLGCGPAREVPALTGDARLRPMLEWTLIDQEEAALAHAYQCARKAIVQRQRQDSVRCLNVSFAQLLSATSPMPVKESQHVIFSTGLFDYLSERRAKTLVAGLYERLEPGGRLIVGNALGPNEHFWSAEFVLDWPLLYRDEVAMARLAGDLPEEAEVECSVEPGGAYRFLLVRRPVRRLG